MEKRNAEKTRSLVSDQQSLKPAGPETSKNLNRDLAGQLLDLMTRVTKDDVTPDTVNAACNCAAQIHKILKLNFDMQKEGL